MNELITILHDINGVLHGIYYISIAMLVVKIILG